jgi:hypothetical protein
MTNTAASLSSQESINAIRQHPIGWNSIAPRKKDEARLFAPCQALRPLPEFALHQDHDSPIHPNQTPDFCDLKVTGTWPIPIYASELHHPGFVVESTQGIACHNPGDTAFHEGSAPATNQELQVTSGCIDGGFNTSNPRDAA